MVARPLLQLILPAVCRVLLYMAGGRGSAALLPAPSTQLPAAAAAGSALRSIRITPVALQQCSVRSVRPAAPNCGTRLGSSPPY